MGRKFNTRCYLDVTIGDGRPERIVLELFDEKCPKACDNFKKLCEGVCGIGMKTGKPLHYKGSVFHRIIKGFIIQGGDFSNGDGTGGESIYGGTFADEDMSMLHDRPFLLSMANRGPNTNGSQFFITTAPAPHLNGKHMIFGHVLSGQEIVAKIEAVPVSDTRVYKPLKPVVIVNCGELIPVKKKKSKDSKKSSKKKKEKKKKHKKKKKSKKQRRSSSESMSGSDSDSVKVRPEEIPDVPQNKFLYRPGPSAPTEIEFGTNQNNAVVSKSGRKVKGRGQVRYRSPNMYTGGSGRAYTPEHWHQASRNESYHRTWRDDYRTHANRFADAMGIDRNEERVSKAVLRSPLNGHERSSRHIREKHFEDTRDMSPTHRRRDSRNYDRNDRRVDRYADNDRRMRDKDLSPPPCKRLPIDYSSQGEDEKKPDTCPSQSPFSRDYKNGHSKRREKSHSDSPRRKSPSPPNRVSGRKRSLSGSPEISPIRSAKRRNYYYSDAKATPERKREVSKGRSPSNEKQHFASRSPPAYLVSKWEERHRENQRKRESMKRTESERQDSDDGIAVASHSPALKPITSRHRRGSSVSPSLPCIQRSPPKRTASPKSALVNSSVSVEKPRTAMRSPLLKAPPSPITASPRRLTVVPDEAVPTKKPRSPLLSPPLHIKPPAVADSMAEDSHSTEVKPSSSHESPSKREWSSSSKGAKKGVQVDATPERKSGDHSDQEETGPWTTSRWQTDETENGAQVSSTKKSPVKLALGGSNSTEAIPQPIDMDVSDGESDAKISEPPGEKKSSTSTTKSSKAPAKKIRSRSVSSSGSSTTSVSSRSRTRRPSRSSRSSSSSSAVSRSHSRRRSSGSTRSRRSRRDRIRSSSSRSRSRRRRKMSSSRSSLSRRRHSRRRRKSYTRSSSRDRLRGRRRRSSSSVYSRRRQRRSYSSYSSASSRSTYSSVSRRR